MTRATERTASEIHSFSNGAFMGPCGVLLCYAMVLPHRPTGSRDRHLDRKPAFVALPELTITGKGVSPLTSDMKVIAITH